MWAIIVGAFLAIVYVAIACTAASTYYGDTKKYVRARDGLLKCAARPHWVEETRAEYVAQAAKYNGLARESYALMWTSPVWPLTLIYVWFRNGATSVKALHKSLKEK